MIEIQGTKLYDRDDLQTLFGVSKSTLTNICKRGEMASVRIGRKLYVSEDALKAFLDGRATSPK